ncbi:MAG TPA: sigma-54-dependent Fis family transcriptional regulator [Candidatus Binatia bacterium]|nr:sigma-54-dependent Fis family transcriptional regulator [Candidatus Binatia bacterium]
MKYSEDQLRAFVNTIPTPAWSSALDGCADFFNQAWLDYTGLSADQSLEWGWKGAIHADDLPWILGAFQEAVNSEQPFEVEGRFRRTDGEFRWFLVRGSPLRDASGKVVRWCGTNTDIDDRKRAEEALRESERRFRLIVDGIAGLVAIMTPQGEVEFVNNQVLEYFGKTVEQLKGWTTNDAVHPDDLPNTVAAWRHSVETGAPYDVDHRLRRADGAYRWYHSHGLSLRDAEGRIVRWYNLLTDIDERKKVEEKLRRSEESLLDAQKLSHTGSFRHEVSTGKVIISPEVYRIYDVKTDEDASSTEFFFNRFHPDDRNRVVELFGRSENEKIDFQVDNRIVLSDGTIKHLHSIGHPVLNESGELVEFVGTTMDVTDHVQARVKLENALEEINRLKDQLHDENIVLREQIDQAFMFEEIVGSSAALQTVLSSIVKVAPTDSTVLITGETGTGKELIARAIHKRSRRSGRAFVSVNCASIPSSLIASELFGHEKGAFTGALQQRQGRFELAHSGTIFLDEVGELPAETQTTLLRVLQERQFERVGGNRMIPADIRVIAATNRDLPAAIAVGAFRADLFYRLNVFPVQMPPLRKRKEDIPLLVEYFVKRFAEKMGKHICSVDKKTIALCQRYDWPGNIRELQNIIERSIILCGTDTFSIDEAWMSTQERSGLESAGSLTEALQNQERKLIEAALAESKGKIAGSNGAAARLGIPASTLDSKMRQFNIQRNKFTQHA